MMRIIIVDDHAVMREGVKQILADDFPHAEFTDASNAQELFDLLRAGTWSAVILDINLPGRNGIEVLKDIHQQHPNLPVLMHSMHPEDQFAIRSIKAGAAGYITKTDPPEELVRALNKILAGGKYITPALAERLAMEVESPTDKHPHELLSDREFEVLRMIASGKTVSQAAVELSLSIKTISTYRARILEKMKMKTNAELTSYAVKRGLVE